MALILAVAFGSASGARAVTVSQNVTVPVPVEGGGSTIDATLVANSSFGTLTVTGSSLSITVASGQSVTLNNSQNRAFKNDQGVQTICTAPSSITLSAGKTYSIQIGGACVGGGGGGGGSGFSPPPPPPVDTGGSSGGGPVTVTPPPPPSPAETILPPPPNTLPLPPPPPISQVQLPTSEMQFGVENDDVTKLQALLATDPSIYPEGKVTGYFGPATRAAVKRFQAKYGLATPGRVGPQTLAKLAEIFGGGIGSTLLPPQQTSPSGALTKTLNPGANGNDVALLQLFLAKDKDIYPEGIVNGNYGPLTTKAVKRFQAKYGIPQVGRVGPVTLKKIQELWQ